MKAVDELITDESFISLKTEGPMIQYVLLKIDEANDLRPIQIKRMVRNVRNKIIALRVLPS